LLQAAIASQQAEDPPDWPRIVTLYGELAAITGSPVVSSTAPSPSPRQGTAARAGDRGCARADRIPVSASTRAELLRRLGKPDQAATAYRRALGLTPAEPERRFLERRLDQL